MFRKHPIVPRIFVLNTLFQSKHFSKRFNRVVSGFFGSFLQPHVFQIQASSIGYNIAEPHGM